VRMQDTLDRLKRSYNLQGNPLWAYAMCFSANVQCKLLSSIHAAKYRDTAHNLGSIAVLHNCTYVSSLRQLAVMVIFEETIIQVNE
jgi:hypothetical protein